MRRTLTLATLFLIAAAPLVHASDASTDAVKKIAQALGDQTVAAAKVEDRDERRRLLRAAATPALDFKAIGAGVLAYAGAKIPPAREAEVLDEVIGYVADNIAAEIERIRPEIAKVGEVEMKGDNEARVAMALSGTRDSIDALWLFKKNAGTWRVTDVQVSGASLTAHYGEKLSRHARGVDQLVDYLRNQQKRANQTALRQ